MPCPARAVGVLCVLIALSLLLPRPGMPGDSLRDLLWLPMALTIAALIVALAFNIRKPRDQQKSIQTGKFRKFLISFSSPAERYHAPAFLKDAESIDCNE